jgi:aspartate racemase
VQRERVFVGVQTDGLPADAGVERVADEAHALCFKVCPGGADVIGLQRADGVPERWKLGSAVGRAALVGMLSAMKRIGLLGGMSWESSAEYYRLINEATRDRLGGLHSADCVMRSVDFADIEEMQSAGAWGEAGERLAAEARSLVAGGAELLVLCTNTMHKVSEAIVAAVEIPFLHIADATADAIAEAGISTVGLLATAYTMEQDFYVGRLRERHGLDVLVPNEKDRRLVHDVIYDELCVGIINDSSRSAYREVISDLVERGAHGVLLGCTEIGLLVSSTDAEVPLFDTARLHAQRAVELALQI